MPPAEGARFFAEMGNLARQDLPRDEVLSKMVRLSLEYFAVDLVAYLIYDPVSESAYVSASAARNDELHFVSTDITLRVSAGSCLRNAALDPGSSVLVPEGSDDPVLGPVRGLSLAVVPSVSGDSLVGFMLLGAQDIASLQGPSASLFLSVASYAATLVRTHVLTEHLRQSEERYRMLTETTAGLAFVLDRGGRFLYVNQRARDVLGYRPEELVGRYYGEFVTPESWAKTTAKVKEAARNQAKYVEYEWVALKKGGEHVTLNIEASLDYDGFDVFRHQGVARDASTEILLKEELLQVKSREERMRDYLSVATLAQEEERARIAREIHDGAIQHLVAVGRRMDLVKKELMKRTAAAEGAGDAKDPGAAKHLNGARACAGSSRKASVLESLLSDIDSLLDSTTADLRRFARNLRPPILDDFGLVSACEYLAGELQKEGVQVVFVPRGVSRRLEPELEIAAFRIAQEALANVAKHSGATLVDFGLAFKADKVELTISDNGKGFELHASPSPSGGAGQMGLVGMYERAQLVGAEMEIRSKPGEGTSIHVSIPCCAEMPTPL